jgi:hypothetical protein
MIKAGPLILIAIGLSLGFKARGLEHRGRGAIHHRRDLRGGVRLAFYPSESPLIFPVW